MWYLIALGVWAVGLLIWRWVDRSMARYALEAISEDEDAAAAAGVNVTFEKLRITVISALMTALRRRALLPVPDVHLARHGERHRASRCRWCSPSWSAASTWRWGRRWAPSSPSLLAEVLRIFFGTKAVGWDNLVYGVLLVLFIIFLPKGILGSLLERGSGSGAEALQAPRIPSGAARPRTRKGRQGLGA